MVATLCVYNLLLPTFIEDLQMAAVGSYASLESSYQAIPYMLILLTHLGITSKQDQLVHMFVHMYLSHCSRVLYILLE